MKIPNEAIEHAKRDYPRESCGLIVDGRYFPCRNESSIPGEQFVINKNDYNDAIDHGEIEAVIHSHPECSPMPSKADRAGCEHTAVKWGIIGIKKTESDYEISEEWIYPCGYSAPILGREYVWGVFDCLSILFDYYEREMGIDFGDFDRPDEDWAKNADDDIYTHQLIKNGFERIDRPEKNGDIVLMQIRARVPNHAAIFLADGIIKSESENHPVPMSILHHLQGRASCRDIYGGYWAEKTVSIWRLKG